MATGTRLFTDLHKYGFSQMQTDSNKERMVETVLIVSSSLGNLVRGRRQIVETLRPIHNTNSLPKSLSAMFGLSDFPWHIDTAHWTTPARYIVLGCIDPGALPIPTILLDWKAAELPRHLPSSLDSARFLVKNGGRSFYAVMRMQNTKYFRHDVGCMIPTDKIGSSLQHTINNFRYSTMEVSIDWDAGIIVVIDNWRMLHRRTVATFSQDRCLLRCYVQ